MLWFLLIVVLGLVWYCIALNIRVRKAQDQLDRHQIIIDKIRSLQDEMTRLISRMQRIETMTHDEMVELRTEIWNVQATVRDAFGDLSVEVPIPADYDDVPNYDYRNDPGGQTIEGMLTRDRRNREAEGNGTRDPI